MGPAFSKAGTGTETSPACLFWSTEALDAAASSSVFFEQEKQQSSGKYFFCLRYKLTRIVMRGPKWKAPATPEAICKEEEIKIILLDLTTSCFGTMPVKQALALHLNESMQNLLICNVHNAGYSYS